MISEKTMSEVKTLRNLPKEPLKWVMEENLAKQGDDLLWLEFGVWKGTSINYISRFTEQPVYGFDSFEGLPEFWRNGFNEGAFNENGTLPQVSNNVFLIKGWFEDVLPDFLGKHAKRKVSFAHLDADLYSSTKFVLTSIAPFLANDAVLVFDELINYEGFDNGNGELRAWDEFVNEYSVNYSWIGGHGEWGQHETHCEKAAVMIHGIKV